MMSGCLWLLREDFPEGFEFELAGAEGQVHFADRTSKQSPISVVLTSSWRKIRCSKEATTKQRCVNTRRRFCNGRGVHKIPVFQVSGPDAVACRSGINAARGKLRAAG